jgi:hypothetical protein
MGDAMTDKAISSMERPPRVTGPPHSRQLTDERRRGLMQVRDTRQDGK